MCVLCVRTSGEADGLVAGGELDVEPGDDGVDEVAAADFHVEGAVEGEVGDGAGVEVKGDDRGGVGDDSLDVDGVDEGLGNGGCLEGGVVEAPDVVPDCLISMLAAESELCSAYIQSSPPCSRHPRYQP